MLHAVELEAIMPKVGYSFRYFPLQSESSQNQFYLGKLGLGGVTIDGVSLVYLSAAGGVGYQWARHSTIEFVASYTLTSGRDFISGAVMLRGILW